jgi:type I restriction enzyme, S subunit
MSEWKELTLREAGISLIDCDHKTPLPTDKGLPYIAIPQLEDGCINFSDARLISEEDFKIWTRKANPQTHDVVLSRRCNPGESAYVADGMRFALGQNLVLLRSDGKLVIKPFLRWLIKSPAWWSEVSKFINVGAVFNSLKCGEIINFTLPIPSIHEQESISKTLSCVDAKIDNLRRQNETLEEIARSIFKHWFIDFEFPNADGKPYKSSGGAMVRSDLGDIPEGWRVGKLGDIAKNIKNGIRESEIRPEMLHIGLEHIPRRCIALDSWEQAVGVASNKFKFVEGNILFGKLRPYFHKVGIAPVGGICSTDILVVDSKEKAYFEIVLMLLSSDDFIRYVTLASEGTRMPRTSWEYMKDYPITVSNSPLTKKFNELLHPSIEKLKVNIFQIQTLTKTRDALLPKLMSGQLRVKE